MTYGNLTIHVQPKIDRLNYYADVHAIDGVHGIGGSCKENNFWLQVDPNKLPAVKAAILQLAPGILAIEEGKNVTQ